MPHTVESTISLSDRDLERGALDLVPEVDTPVNSTIYVNSTVLETAVSVIKEAGPKIVEAISQHLMPVLPQFSEAYISPPRVPAPDAPPYVPASTIVPEVMVSPPIGTIVIIPSSTNNSQSPAPTAPDTVRSRLVSHPLLI
jgi:hypothetical protein